MMLLCPTAARALSAPTETSLRSLMEEYGLDSGDDLLNSLTKLSTNLGAFSIVCEPPIGLGGLDDRRVLASVSANSIDAVLDVIAQGEKADVEFKSSLLLDVRRYRNEPGGELKSYRLEGVTRALMKTIAAFANSGGGTVFVGVEDDTTICGLSEDFILANPQRRDFDGWDQCLRGQIESSFFDGRTVANYVKARPLEFDGRTFVQMQVADRATVTFLKKAGGGAELYVRSGTRSIPIDFQDIEKHYNMIRQF